MSHLSDQLETDYGTAILEDLTGETLTRKGQPVRLFDQSGRTSECYYLDDGRGKPYIYDHKEGKRWYPITAYKEANSLDWHTALRELTIRYIGDTKGRGKHYTPRRSRPALVSAPPAPISYHERALVDSTLNHYERNDFAIYLGRLFGNPVANELLDLFQVGSGWQWGVSPEWGRSVVFWQIDEQGQVRAGKVMAYSPATGRRLKEKSIGQGRPYWVHEILSLKDFHYEQCLFGLHQITQQPTSKTIAIVESEKTAIIATAFMPSFIWLACGGLDNLTAAKCRVLAGRDLTLFPDLKGFDKWNKKADELQRIGCWVSVSGILEAEGRATVLERDAGYDLADFLTPHRCPDTGRVLNEPDGYPALLDCEPLNTTPTIHLQSINEYLNQAN
ncbi:MAG: hypothetical protein JWP57_236 [Spirosoma sp.]|nr:hypothetical protein [Spirosoma sp.]